MSDHNFHDLLKRGISWLTASFLWQRTRQQGVSSDQQVHTSRGRGRWEGKEGMKRSDAEQISGHFDPIHKVTNAQEEMDEVRYGPCKKRKDTPGNLLCKQSNDSSPLQRGKIPCERKISNLADERRNWSVNLFQYQYSFLHSFCLKFTGCRTREDSAREARKDQEERQVESVNFNLDVVL